MKDVVIVFDAMDHSVSDWVKMYQSLAELGFSNSAKGVKLPASAMVGTWLHEASLAEIHTILVTELTRIGIQLKSLLVIEYSEMVWVHAADTVGSKR